MYAPSRDQLPQRARQHLGAGRSRLIYNPYSTATWRIASASGEACYLKAAFVGTYPSLTAERERCMWLREWVSVPEVVDHGADNGVEWMLTAALPGVNATAPKHLADPEVTVPLLADGLRSFHDIDPAASPFDYRMPVAGDPVARRIAAGAVAIDGFHDVHRGLDPSTALARLDDLNIEECQLVVCHGDYTPPNVLLDAGGSRATSISVR
jgi:kanamycin kinase